MEQSNCQKQPKIGDIVTANANFLRHLACTKSQNKRRKLLKGADSEKLLALAEICLNIIKSRFRLTTRQKKRLMPYAEFVRRMSRARSERGARKVLVQKGGGAPGVFAALLTPVLIEMARTLIKGKEQTN